jgi:hypothetical protein
MAIEVAVTKQLGALRPSIGQEEAFNKIPNGPAFIVVKYAKRARNVRQHRLYWALMNIIAENTDRGWSSEGASFFMKIATGHYDEITDAHGNVYKNPRSISFAAMDQGEFQVFMDKCIKLVCERIIPGLPEGDLRRTLMEMVA